MTTEVYKAIAAITEHFSSKGISKDSRNSQQGFMYRGIDAVYNALAPELAKQELCILPRCIDRTVSERITTKGGVLFYVAVKVDFEFVSAKDGSKHVITTYGEAMDSGDKATNKAMSVAYKYAAFQAFCIPTEENTRDPDAEVHEVQSDVLMELVAELDAAETEEELKAVFAKAWKASKGNQSIKAHYDKLKERFVK